MLKKIIRAVAGKPVLLLFRMSRWPLLIPWIKRLENFQISPGQARCLCQRIWEKKGNCRLLVFGVGNDSRFWMAANAGGQTLFLENDARWIEKISRITPELEIVRVEYSTRCSEWKSDLGNLHRLSLSLPSEMTEHPWDLILVDAPAGDTPGSPGRLQSIFTAGQLVAPGGWIFVHDTARDLEQHAPSLIYGREKLALSLGNMDGFRF